MKLADPTLVKKYIFAGLVAVAFGAGYYYHGHASLAEAHATPSPSIAASSSNRMALAGLPDFGDIVNQQGPAVVNISVSAFAKKTSSSMQMPEMDPDDPFYQFFRHFQPQMPQNEEPAHALGSGFIVKSDGTILTNAHVVADADEVMVKLTDKREFKAKVLGLDKTSDVAVLKIDASDLPTVKIGDPQNSHVGEWVVAIGSPFGFENSVTAGIISAKSRSLPDDGYVPFLQTDVAINPGNSGGPLFNLNGEVIGINSQIYSRSGGYQGLSFSIPIDVAMKVEKQLVDHGKVSRGRLGVYVQPVDQQLAQSFGLDKPRGALITTVEDDSPAEKAGLESGDVILKFNGKDIERSQDLPPEVADLTPGSSARLEVWHNGKTRNVTVKLGEMQTASAEETADAPSQAKLGLAVRPLSPEEKREAEVSQGLIVENVSDGPAARAGIRAGDLILSVNGEKVGNIQQLKSLVEKNHKHMALLVMRGDSKMFVPIDLG